jgi:hypothetical protein
MVIGKILTRLNKVAACPEITPWLESRGSPQGGLFD